MVLDAVGRSTFGRCRRLLKPAGIYISTDLGPLGQNVILPLVTRLFGGKRVIFPLPRYDQGWVTRLKELIESGEFKPVIDRRYSLDQIVEAYRLRRDRAEDRQCRDQRRYFKPLTERVLPGGLLCPACLRGALLSCLRPAGPTNGGADQAGPGRTRLKA